jgi:hypothetical protein
MKIKYQGEDGNIFFIIGRCRNAMKEARLSKDEIEAFTKEVMATHAYYDALGVVTKWLTRNKENMTQREIIPAFISGNNKKIHALYKDEWPEKWVNTSQVALCGSSIRSSYPGDVWVKTELKVNCKKCLKKLLTNNK